MALLDTRTIVVVNLLSDVVILAFIYRLWQQNHNRFAGIGFWLADFILQFLAAILLVLRGKIPDSLSVIGGNAALIGGTILLLIGLEAFVGKPGPQWQNAIFFAAFLTVHTYFLYIVPSLPARNINISIGLIVICGQGAWLTLRRVDAKIRPHTQGVGYVFLMYCLVSLFRIGADLAVPGGNDFFHSDVWDALVVLILELLLITLNFTLFLAVNRRLVADLESDIRQRSGTEEALRVSEEKFSKAFHSTPDAVLISRARDGLLLEVNDGFTRTTGYARDEALGATTPGIRLWADPRERDEVLGLLARFGSLTEREYQFRSKDGRIFPGLYSGALIQLGGEPHIVSIVRDISVQKEIEAILKLRVHLWEYSVSHPLLDLLQETLDRIGEISASPIGFFHYVDEDQQGVSLQTWSTRTLKEFCRAEGAGKHYPLEQAGIWADAIRQKRPTIENDYAAAAGRKGLPEGHAEVKRYLVVPILRGNRTVAVFGIGNKPTDYLPQDLEFANEMADIAWTVIDHKRTEEQIHQLQEQLRAMALHDPLTGLLNRYYLEETIKRELARATREEYPVSFVMIDIDGFKAVNDTFGHKTGDAVLQHLAGILKKRSRGSDLVYRYGGEEFLAVLPKVTAEFALQVAEKWRKNFQESSGLLEQGKHPVTISCGIAAFPAHGSLVPDLIAKSDQALYDAKAAGRNRSMIWKKSTKSLHS